MGDRSKSVPGLNMELVRPSVSMEPAARWRSCLAGHALVLPTQAVDESLLVRRRRRKTLITWWRSIARGWPGAACAVAPRRWVPAVWPCSALLWEDMVEKGSADRLGGREAEWAAPGAWGQDFVVRGLPCLEKH